jgi:hypothetical protein
MTVSSGVLGFSGVGKKLWSFLLGSVGSGARNFVFFFVLYLSKSF